MWHALIRIASQQQLPLDNVTWPMVDVLDTSCIAEHVLTESSPESAVHVVESLVNALRSQVQVLSSGEGIIEAYTNQLKNERLHGMK